MLTRTRKQSKSPQKAEWKLQDAKARFSEVVRLAETEGPQHVSVHGKPRVVVVSASDFARATSSKSVETGAALISAMKKGRQLGLVLKPAKIRARYRAAVDLGGDGK